MSALVQWRGFRGQCPPHWPVWVKHWAASKGSLTSRLKTLSGDFVVTPIAQSHARLSAKEASWLGLRVANKTRYRCVLLQVGGLPVVAAKTWMAHNGPRCDWRFWSGLGARSLGSQLFSDPMIKRGRVHFRKLPLASKWVRHLLGDALYSNLIKRYKMDGWYVRGARFDRHPNHTPLWVFEVFLPTLKSRHAKK